MGCRDVKRVIYFYLDGSVGEKTYNELVKHFGLCPDCEQRRKIHQRLRDFVRRRIQRIPATERLKVRLTRSIRALQADI